MPTADQTELREPLVLPTDLRPLLPIIDPANVRVPTSEVLQAAMGGAQNIEQDTNPAQHPIALPDIDPAETMVYDVTNPLGDFMATVSIPGGPDNVLAMKGPLPIILLTLRLMHLHGSLQGQHDPCWVVFHGPIPGPERRCWVLQWTSGTYGEAPLA